MPKSASLQWPSWSNSTLSSLRSLKERASSICRTARPHTPMGWLVGWVIRPHQASFRHPPQRKQTSLGYLGKSFGSTLKICLMVPRQWSYVNRSPRLTTERQWFPLMVGGGVFMVATEPSFWSLTPPPPAPPGLWWGTHGSVFLPLLWESSSAGLLGLRERLVSVQPRITFQLWEGRRWPSWWDQFPSCALGADELIQPDHTGLTESGHRRHPGMKTESCFLGIPDKWDKSRGVFQAHISGDTEQSSSLLGHSWQPSRQE